MNKIDTDSIKQSHNIVDVIDRFVPLKKHGQNWFGCCPFHGEKTPSFSVDEKDQFYHCFGCGANGDVIKFVQEYSGLDFIEACKELGAEIELMPAKKIQQNIDRSRAISSLPSYDKRDPEKCEEWIKKATLNESGAYNLYDLTIYPVIDFDGQIVNLYDPVDEKFFAGGVSHLAFTPIKKNDSDTWLVVVDFWQGLKVSHDRQMNVMIVYSAYNMLLSCQHNSEHKKIPVLRYEDTQAELLCDKGYWIYSDENKKLFKKNKGDYLDG